MSIHLQLPCADFSASRCRSCTLLEVLYAEQLRSKQTQAQSALAEFFSGRHDGCAESLQPWQAPVPTSRLGGFRNKAKLAVSGPADQPLLGIVEPKRVVELAHCPLYSVALRVAIEQVRSWLGELAIEPYRLDTRRGELKFVLLSSTECTAVVAEDARYMLRLVLRSRAAEAKLRAQWPRLLAQFPALTVFSLNIQSEPKAILEGALEIPISSEQHLPFQLNGMTLLLQPGGFFQTHTDLAAALYQQCAQWFVQWRRTVSSSTVRVHDLYCGVGGFALHVAGASAAEGLALSVHGFEISAAAVEAAARSAGLPQNGLNASVQPSFSVCDATELQPVALAANALIVNPPRRGLGEALAKHIAQAAPQRLWYSSCNIASLVSDLRHFQSVAPLRIERARVFDLFAHTEHFEVLVEISFPVLRE